MSLIRGLAVIDVGSILSRNMANLEIYSNDVKCDFNYDANE